MPKTNLLPVEWLKNFNNAILQRDIESVALFLNSLPDFETPDQIRECLALTMDAEVLVCNTQKELIEQRQNFHKKLSL